MIFRFVPFLLNLLATIQCVWFYLMRVPSALCRDAYEKGLERTPFQERALWMVPMRWAHETPFLIDLARRLSATNGWLPPHIEPEGLIEAAADVVSIVVAGSVARSLYRSCARKAGRSAFFTPVVYPLTLLMISVTYCGMVSHAIRFLYDLPALAFFSGGIYLLYHRRSLWWFCLLFVIGTINRETTFLLLPLLVLARSKQHQPVSDRRPQDNMWRSTLRSRQAFVPQTILATMALSLFWLSWHFWIQHHFAGNATASGPRLLLNIGTILCPLAWPQIASIFAYLLPIVVVGRHKIPDRVLRSWLLVLPLWALFMLFKGLWIETRIFGELISLISALTVLIAETYFLEQFDLEDPRDRIGPRCPS